MAADEIERLRERVSYLECTLGEIAKGKGPYGRDPLENANTISDMKNIAKRALIGLWIGGEDE